MAASGTWVLSDGPNGKPALAGGYQGDTNPGTNIALLTDGLFGSEGVGSTAYGASCGSVLTLTLSAGYDLSNIVTTSGSGSGYNQYTTQNYSVDVHQSGGGWTNDVVSGLQTNIDDNAGGAQVQNWRSVQVTTAFATGELTNIDQIRFTLLPTPSTTYATGQALWYREIEVTGTAVPEPASLGLPSLPAMALLRRRRGN